MKVVYFGTPQFAAKVLTYLLENNIEIVAVVTKPDRPQGRSGKPIPTPVKTIAEQAAIPVLQPELISAPEPSAALEAYHADLFVVVAYGEIIKQHLLDMPTLACINLHASLLPTYRGAAPIQRCIINGEKETGISIMHMAKKMDAGDIISMEKLSIGSDMTYGELEEELCDIGSKLLLKTIRNFEKGSINSTAQDHSLATFAPKIEIEDCEIKWNQPALHIHDLVRGVNPQPGAWCQVLFKGMNKRLRVIKTSLVSQDSSEPPGKILTTVKNKLQVSCDKGILEIVEIQLEGKKVMLAEEFMRGLTSGALQFILN